MQYSVARDAYEPFSEEENDEFIWQCDAARNRHNDRSGFLSAQRLMGVHPRLPRSITSDDIVDPLETIDCERDDYQRNHEMRMAAAIGFIKRDATHRLQVLAKARPRTQWGPQQGDWVMLHRNNGLQRWNEGPCSVIHVSGTSC